MQFYKNLKNSVRNPKRNTLETYSHAIVLGFGVAIMWLIIAFILPQDCVDLVIKYFQL